MQLFMGKDQKNWEGREAGIFNGKEGVKARRASD